MTEAVANFVVVVYVYLLKHGIDLIIPKILPKNDVFALFIIACFSHSQVFFFIISLDKFLLMQVSFTLLLVPLSLNLYLSFSNSTKLR